MNKTKIVDAVQSLLSSSRDRETSQGILVYENVLKMLDIATSEAEVQDTLGKLNRSLAGIEAHGDLTNDEYELVRLLRTYE